MSALVDAELALLRRENAVLEERVYAMEELLRPSKLDFGTDLGLTKQESMLLACLIRGRGRGVLSKEHLLGWMYAFRHDGEEPEIKIVDVYICKARKKLKPFDVNITTVWGQGYLLDRENLDRLLAYKGYTYADLDAML